MKLRNKKTGEIVSFHYLQTDYLSPIVLTITQGEKLVMKKYNSLAELNEEWEDAPEEPKGSALYLMILTLTNFIENEPDEDKVNLKDCKQMLEKLKAWKRLKDKGFVWQGWDEGTMNNGMCIIDCQIPENNWETDVVEDLDLLFGGEE